MTTRPSESKAMIDDSQGRESRSKIPADRGSEGLGASTGSEPELFDVPWTDRGDFEWKKRINGNGATILTLRCKHTGSETSRCGCATEAELDDMEMALREIPLIPQNDQEYRTRANDDQS